MDKISILISFRNEEDNIKKFIENVKNCFLEKKIKNYEIIFVDDNSSDKSFNILSNFSRIDQKIKIIKMKKRYGHSHSIQAGLENIDENNFCVIMDCDLQDPPELIAKNLDFNDKINTVHFVRKSRDDSFFQKIYSSVAYYVLYFISFGKIIKNAGYFKIIPPAVTKSLKLDCEFLPYWNYLITKHSLKNKIIYYTRKKRFMGESKFSFISLNPWLTYFGGLYHFKLNFIIISVISLILTNFIKFFSKNFLIDVTLNLIGFFIFANLFFFLIYILLKYRKKKIKCDYELINFF